VYRGIEKSGLCIWRRRNKGGKQKILLSSYLSPEKGCLGFSGDRRGREEKVL
jgi:hypothetical protein